MKQDKKVQFYGNLIYWKYANSEDPEPLQGNHFNKSLVFE